MTEEQPTKQSMPDERFPTLAALRYAHQELLRAMREGSEVVDYTATIVAFIQRGLATGKVLESEDDRLTAQSLLDYWSATLYRAGIAAPDATLDEFDPQLEPELADSSCPYVGLEPFDESTQDRFFGRQRLVANFLIERLQQRHMIVLLGPMGSGKTSVLNAGLIPALKKGAISDSQSWHYHTALIPGADPLGMLASLLVPNEDSLALERHRAGMLASDRYALEHLRPGAPPIVLLIDQLEELFLQASEADQRAFINNVLQLVQSQASYVLTALRSEFESQIPRYPELQATFELGTRVQLLPLTAAELREAIERPAEQVGLKFESGLVDRLIEDMLGEPSALPLLQFTLMHLWDQREHNRITWNAYNTVGSGRMALARSADAVYQSFSREDQLTARRLLLQLARPLSGFEPGVRAMRMASLLKNVASAEQVRQVIMRLYHARLVRIRIAASPDDTQVEIAHDALVRHWPTLVNWLHTEQSALEVRRNLEAKVQEWVRLGRGNAGLLDAIALAEAERWIQSDEAQYIGFDPNLSTFVQTSRTALEELQQRELAQARALAQAEHERAEAQERRAEVERQRAEEQTRGRQRITQAFRAIGVLCMLALIAAIFALQQSNRANQSAAEVTTKAVALQTAEVLARQKASEAEQNAQVARTSESQAVENQRKAESAAATAVVDRSNAQTQQRLARAGQLAAQSQAVGERLPQLSLLLAAESLNMTLRANQPALPVADRTARDALLMYTGSSLYHHDQPVLGVAFTSDGRLVSVGNDQIAQVWNSTLPNQAPTLIPFNMNPRLMAMSSDGKALVIVGEGASAQLIDVSVGKIVAVLDALSPITALAISGNGQRVALANEAGETRVWNVGTSAAPRILRPQSGQLPPVRAISLNPDGRLLLTGSDDGIARLYDLNRNDPIFPVVTTTRRPALTSVSISPDGRWAVIGSRAGDTHLWQLSSAGFVNGPFVLLGQTRAISLITINSDSTLCATGSDDGTTFLWRLQARDLPGPRSVLRGHRQRITGLQITPNNKQLITASADGTASIWDLTAEDPGATQRRLIGHDGGINGTALSADGALLATAGADGSVRLWNLTKPLLTDAALPNDPHELIVMICKVAGRSMTEEEWQRMMPADESYHATCGQ